MSFSASRLIDRGLLPAGLVAVLAAGPASATDYLLGPMDQLAIDQPRVVFGLTDESDPNNPILIGPLGEAVSPALLDTGANGILLGQISFTADEDYGQPMFNGQPATYLEQGVAGFESLDVYEPHDLRLLDSNGLEFVAAEDVIAFGSDNISLGSFSAIIGMPAMDGRVVDIDMRPMLTPELFVHANFHDSIDQVAFESAASIHVDLRMTPPVHTDTTLPEAMRPTFAALPVVDNIRLDHAGGANGNGQTLTTSNTFLMDTGAQTMIISESMATSLGINFEEFITNNGDVVDVLEVGGIGGNTVMPMVIVEELRLPTADGIDLVYTDVLTGVLDIEGAPFDAVVGMNMLSSGYFNALFGGGGGDTLTNPNMDKETLEFLIEFDTITSVQDLFDNQIITLTQEDFQTLVDFEFLTDPTDPLTVFCELRLLDEQSGSSGANGAFFDRVVFDFTATDGTGIMRLDFNALAQAGDANLDGFVGTEDLDLILANWEDAVRAGNVLAGDLTGDGLVNDADLQLVLAHWGEGTDPNAAVPEPASAALLGLGLLLLPRRR